MTGTYDKKQLIHGEGDKASPSRSLLYDICASAACTVLFTLAGWGGTILLDRFLTLIHF